MRMKSRKLVSNKFCSNTLSFLIKNGNGKYVKSQQSEMYAGNNWYEKRVSGGANTFKL